MIRLPRALALVLFAAPSAAGSPPPDPIVPLGQIQRPSAFVVVSRSMPDGVPKAVADREARLTDLEAAFAARPTSVSADELLVLGALRIDAIVRALESELATWSAKSDRGDDPGPPPVADLRPARDAFAAALDRAPKSWPRAFEAHEQLAWLLSEEGPAHDGGRARAELLSVTSLVTLGSAAGRAHFHLAEIAFENQDMKAARASYDTAVRADPTGPLAEFAAYKAAWSSFNLGDTDDAIARTEALVRSALPTSTLAREAERDVTIMWASLPDKARPAAAHLLALSPSHGAELVVRLARNLLELDRKRACLEALDALGPVPPLLESEVTQLRADARR